MVSLKIPAKPLFPTSMSCIAAYHELATTTIQAAIFVPRASCKFFITTSATQYMLSKYLSLLLFKTKTPSIPHAEDKLSSPYLTGCPELC